MDSEALREKRDKLNAEAKALIEEKRKLIDSSKELLAQVNEYKKQRDERNEKVRESKDKRKKILQEANEYKKQLDDVFSTLGSLQDSVQGSYSRLKQELGELDWEYQTGVQSAKKEKELVKQMDELESQLRKHSECREIQYKVHDLQAKMKDLYTEANVYHRLVLGQAKESEEFHKKMFEIFAKIDDCRKKIKEVNGKIDRVKKDADAAHKELMELSKKEGAERKELGNIDEAELKKKAEKILVDFRAGKKITVEELSLLEHFQLY